MVELLQIRFKVAADEQLGRTETRSPLEEAARLLLPAFREGRVRLQLTRKFAQREPAFPQGARDLQAPLRALQALMG